MTDKVLFELITWLRNIVHCSHGIGVAAWKCNYPPCMAATHAIKELEARNDDY